MRRRRRGAVQQVVAALPRVLGATHPFVEWLRGGRRPGAGPTPHGTSCARDRSSLAAAACAPHRSELHFFTPSALPRLFFWRTTASRRSQQVSPGPVGRYQPLLPSSIAQRTHRQHQRRHGGPSSPAARPPRHGRPSLRRCAIQIGRLPNVQHEGGRACRGAVSAAAMWRGALGASAPPPRPALAPGSVRGRGAAARACP